MKKFSRSILTLSLALMLGVGAAAADTIQIKGSDTMVNLGGSLAEGFMKRNPNLSLAVTGGGSGTGVAAMINGTADLAQMSRQIRPQEIENCRQRGFTPVVHVVARDGISVIVHPSHPFTRLSTPQLADIYSGRVTNWSHFGGPNRQIVVLSRDRNSGTHVLFLDLVVKAGGGGSEYGQNVLMLPSTQAIHDEVARNPGAIGYIGLGYVSNRVKALSVARGERGKWLGPYVAPNPQTVAGGSYPIARDLYIYSKGQPSGTVKAYLDYIMTAEGQGIVAREKFVPVK